MVKMRRPVFCAAIVALGMIAVFNARARADEAIDASRETIIQGVRDDVRRKIRERSETTGETRTETASEAAKPPAASPPHGNAAPDTPK
jgi:hypothetical protein